MKRLFLALTPDPDDTFALWESWEVFRISSPRIRWLTPRQYHLTLLFFGDREEGDIAPVTEQMDTAADLYRAPPVVTAGPGQFPPRGKPRVFVETLEDPSGTLASLQASLYRAFNSHFHLESRRFLPHITTARLSRYQGHLQFRRNPPIHFTLRQMILYESVLRPEGAEYTPLYKVELKG